MSAGLRVFSGQLHVKSSVDEALFHRGVKKSLRGHVRLDRLDSQREIVFIRQVRADLRSNEYTGFLRPALPDASFVFVS